MSIPWAFQVMKILARWDWFADRLRRKTAADLEAAAGRSVSDPELLARTVRDREAWPLFTALLLSTYDRMGRRIAGTENDIRVTRSLDLPLERMDVPVLVVHGTADPHLPFEEHAGAFRDRVPKVEVLALDGGSHVAIFTHRRIVRPRVADFMVKHFR